MTPFKNTPLLYPFYENDRPLYEYRSPIDVWASPSPPQYKDELATIQFLEFSVPSGSVLYVPPYWWYSFQYEDDRTAIGMITYITAMNAVANTPQHLQHTWTRYNRDQETRKVKVLKREEQISNDKEGEPQEKQENPENIPILLKTV
jgi:hypothetical protein